MLLIVTSCIALVLAVLFHWPYQRRLALICVAIVVIFTNKPLADHLAMSLEQQYRPFQGPPPADILVLGCNHHETTYLPLSSQPAPCSLNRLVEAAQLWHRNHDATIHLSGSIPNRQSAHTAVSKQFLTALGIPSSQIKTYPEALNTQAEIALLANTILHRPVALVTSAMHMRRAMFWAEVYQLQAIAVPAQQLIRQQSPGEDWQDWIPKRGAIEVYEYFIYETIGFWQGQLTRPKPN